MVGWSLSTSTKLRFLLPACRSTSRQEVHTLGSLSSTLLRPLLHWTTDRTPVPTTLPPTTNLRRRRRRGPRGTTTRTGPSRSPSRSPGRGTTAQGVRVRLSGSSPTCTSAPLLHHSFPRSRRARLCRLLPLPTQSLSTSSHLSRYMYNTCTLYTKFYIYMYIPSLCLLPSLSFLLLPSLSYMYMYLLLPSLSLSLSPTLSYLLSLSLSLFLSLSLGSLLMYALQL